MEIGTGTGYQRLPFLKSCVEPRRRDAADEQQLHVGAWARPRRRLGRAANVPVTISSRVKAANNTSVLADDTYLGWLSRGSRYRRCLKQGLVRSTSGHARESLTAACHCVCTSKLTKLEFSGTPRFLTQDRHHRPDCPQSPHHQQSGRREPPSLRSGAAAASSLGATVRTIFHRFALGGPLITVGGEFDRHWGRRSPLHTTLLRA